MAVAALQVLSPRLEETDGLVCILGGWDLAICSVVFLQGVLCAQFAHFATLDRRDSMWLKFFVAGLALLTTMRSIHALAILWVQNVSFFANVDAASNMWTTHWLSRTSFVVGATTTFYVQMFFCHRLWASALSRKAYIVILCTILFLFGLISAVIVTFFMFSSYSVTTTSTWISIHLGVVLCGDLLMTGNTVFWLLRSKEFVLSRGPTSTIIRSLLRVTVQRPIAIKHQSAAPAALCASINFGTTIGELRGWIPALLMVNFIAGLVLAQLYAWSAMWTLNSRDDICLAAQFSSFTVNLGMSVTTMSDSGTAQSLQTNENNLHPHHGSDPRHKVDKLRPAV
ncbi:hypothetical protein MSAN_02088000 [Mycena sanguinolenta]|uniref:DUF6534 domain-containing protein n=1 Tax=Mycena sanguinolenta TaxID=230812 RepID=A0A8H7CMS6_9AGAR|nr:hypothetical protein MSAN_02088000 [Mycena sanguinolenta]